MRDFIIIMIMIIMGWGCGSYYQEPVDIDFGQELTLMADEMADEMGIEIDYPITVKSLPVRPDGLQVLGHCSYSPGKQVTIDHGFLDKMYEAHGSLEFAAPILLHEIGHCSLGLGHQEWDEGRQYETCDEVGHEKAPTIMMEVLDHEHRYCANLDMDFYMKEIMTR